MKKSTKGALCVLALALGACSGSQPTDKTATPESVTTAYVQALIDCDGPTLAQIVCETNGDTISAADQEHIIRYMEHAVERGLNIPITSFTIDSVRHSGDTHANAFVTYIVSNGERSDTLQQFIQTLKGPDGKWRVNKVHL